VFAEKIITFDTDGLTAVATTGNKIPKCSQNSREKSKKQKCRNNFYLRNKKFQVHNETFFLLFHYIELTTILTEN
jgi:hypothetical protein